MSDKEEKKTQEELVRKLSKEDFERSVELHAAEVTRREREGLAWVCTSCGLEMDYAYMHDGPFDKDGCSNCGHTEAIKTWKAETDES